MKLLAYIRLSLVQSIRESGQLLIIFAVFPIAVSVMMAYFQRDLFSPTTEISKINLNITDKDNSSLSKSLIDFLNTDSLKEVLELKASGEKEDYELVIPKGYEESFLKERKNTLSLEVKKNGSMMRGKVISGILDNYSEALHTNLLLTERSEDSATIEKVAQAINNLSTKELFHTDMVSLKKNLNAYEYFSVSLFGFMYIMLAMSLAASFYAEKENGMYERVMSTAITKIQYLNYNLITCFIYALILNSVYVISYRLLGLSFKVAFPLLAIMILAQSILSTASIALIATFLSKKNSTIVMNVVLIFQVLLGNSFVPLEQIGASSFMLQLSRFSPDVLLSKGYRNLLVYNNFSSIGFYVGAMIIVSIIFYSLSIIRLNWRWGEKI